MSLAKRSITSVAWNSTSNGVSAIVLLIRSILLARWLPVEVFGIYTFANSMLSLSITFTNFGMAGAFLYRAPETDDEDKTAAVHFTLKSIFTFVWLLIALIGTIGFADSQLQMALFVLIVTNVATQLVQTPSFILTRRVLHRRLAVLNLISTITTTLLVLSAAGLGATLWALLLIDISDALLKFLFLYVWKPIWRPKLLWSPPIMRYFLQFGSRNFLAALLNRALDQIDDLWAGAFLGATSLGFYSRAYSFATYPRKVLALPVNAVIGGSYAELKTDRYRLSRMFFLTNALLIRSGFFFVRFISSGCPRIHPYISRDQMAAHA